MCAEAMRLAGVRNHREDEARAVSLRFLSSPSIDSTDPKPDADFVVLSRLLGST